MIAPLPGDIFRKGQVLNNTYEIEGVLGRGGTGEVYRARNRITGRVVALKALKTVFSHNAAYLELMKREEEMRSIVHPAVVGYTDCSLTDDGHVYLVMDYIDGVALSEILERGGASVRDLLVVAHRIAQGLAATHARRIVHRDLSPDNVILRGGDPAEAVIIDFGIAKDESVGARTIVGNDFAGKYEYAAPEQVQGHAEPRSDLYALGATLLATFRGAVPDLGGSPGEIVARKDRPLDTSGVPEPLKRLIDALTHPDPARRPPSAEAAAAEVEALLNPATAPSPVRRRRWLPWAAAGLLLLLAGLWASGAVEALFPRSLPVASPYRLAAAREADGTASLSGVAPDADQRETVAAAFAQAAGTVPPDTALTLAAGAPISDWGAAAAELLATLVPLEEWRLDLLDAEARVTGLAPDRATRDAVTAAFTDAAGAAGLTGRPALAAGPRHLTVKAVEALLAPLADCGPLLPTPPAAGDDYPLGTTIAVTGTVTASGRPEAIRDALAPAIGDRELGLLGVTVLNPELCEVARALPPAPPGGPVSIVLGEGDSPERRLSGTYAVGENPVIDVLLPADLRDGYLWVALVDVSGDVYHLLPNLNRPDNAVADLGTVEGQLRRIRVAFSRAEWQADRSRLSFNVAEPFGHSQLLVFLTARPLFDTLRPQESAASFADALRAALPRADIRSLTRQTLTIRP